MTTTHATSKNTTVIVNFENKSHNQYIISDLIQTIIKGTSGKRFVNIPINERIIEIVTILLIMIFAVKN